MPETRDEIPPGTLEMLILQTLARAEQLHGFEIAEAIQRRSSEILRVEEGSLYPALNRLEERGWIDSSWDTSENNRRARYYRLTPKGRHQLARESARWQQIVHAIGLVMRPVEE